MSCQKNIVKKEKSKIIDNLIDKLSMLCALRNYPSQEQIEAAK